MKPKHLYSSIYCYPETTVLKNKLNIMNEDDLNKFERAVVSLKLAKLIKTNYIGDFSKDHIKYIHNFLFEDIYDFAGDFRIENIGKDYFRFAEFQYIDDELDRLLKSLKSENYLANLSKEIFAKRLAYYLAEINVLHPFREGNGRTTREFIRELAIKNGYYLDWSKVDAKQIFEATIKSTIDYTDLEEIMFKLI